MNLTSLIAVLLIAVVVFYGSGCTPPRPDELDELGTVEMTVKGRLFRLWIADEPSEQSNGLMFVTSERMAAWPDGAQRGMIFVFDYEHHLSFWMRNTLIPLDIAYLDTMGLVVNTHTMAPLDERPGQYPSGKPARFAIEVSAGVFTDVDLRPGDRITIPTTLLKRRP